MTRPGSSPAILLAAALSLAAAPASADEPAGANLANAEELFQQGKAALVAKDYPRACKLLEASLRLDPATGTYLNLAACHEEVGKIATAFGEFRLVEQRARQANQTDREEYARKHADLLAPRLPRVQIRVAPEAMIEGLDVRIDGVPEVPDLWEKGIPVDPGKRRVVASAPGRKSFTAIADVDDEGIRVPVVIPPLPLAPVVVAEPPPRKTTAEDLAAIEAVAASRARRAVGYATGGVGLASLGVGVVTGVFALREGKRSACPAPCYTTNPDGTPSKELEDARAAYDSARVYSTITNIAVVVGAVGVGVGAYFVLTSSPRRSITAIGPGGLRGEF